MVQTLFAEAWDAPKRPQHHSGLFEVEHLMAGSNGERGGPSLQVRAPVVWDDAVASDPGSYTGSYLLKIPRAAIPSPLRPRLLLRNDTVHEPALSGGSESPFCHRSSSSSSGSGDGSRVSSGIGVDCSDGGNSTQQVSNTCIIRGTAILWEGHLPDSGGRVNIAVQASRADGCTGSLKEGKSTLPGKNLSCFPRSAVRLLQDSNCLQPLQ